MTDLVLHVGLSKAGSTTLQKHFFSNFRNYLGYHNQKQYLDTNHLVSELEGLYFEFEFNDHSNLKLKNWARKVRSLNEDTPCPPFKQLIISREHLTGWRGGMPTANGRGFLLNIHSRRKPIRYRPSPTARFLQYLKNYVWIWGQIRIVFILRNQPNWLASQYSQTSNRIINASQKDFQQQIDHLIETRDPYLDWSQWIEEFSEIVGPHNVCVLLMEEMHEEHFWIKLGNFLNIDYDIIKDIYPKTFKKEKQRSAKDDNTWELRKFDPYFYIKTVWPQYKMITCRKYVLNFIKSLQKHNVPLMYNTFTRNDESYIYLTDDIKQKVLHHVALYNKKLEKLLKRNLSHLGY